MLLTGLVSRWANSYNNKICPCLVGEEFESSVLGCSQNMVLHYETNVIIIRNIYGLKYQYIMVRYISGYNRFQTEI